MKKKRVVRVVVIIAAAILGAVLLDACLPENYSSARRQCEWVLTWNRDGMEQAAEKTFTDPLTGSNYTSGEHRGMYYVRYKGDDAVYFYVDSQGMLGGQYWQLVYTPDGTLHGHSAIFEYDEAGGNNITRGEKLADNWWYLWTDYDGTSLSNG